MLISDTKKVLMLSFIILLTAFSAAQCGIYDVTEFGAVGDGKTLNTKAIQSAIDKAHDEGGGRVVLADGTFLTGTIVLKSDVTLYIEAGAAILGSKDLKDYPLHVPEYRTYTNNYTDKSLIYAEKQRNIAISGKGTIDGQGGHFVETPKGNQKSRPYLIKIYECNDVTVENVTIKDSPMWVQHYMVCNGVLIDGITVRSRCNGNNDGLDIDGCENVRIANCNIDSGDDGICLKSTGPRPCENITITNCIISSHCNGFKCGTETTGGFKNVTISNCTIYDTRLAGIALEIVDGGVMDKVTVSNINMKNTMGPIFIRLGNRARPYKAQGGGNSNSTFDPADFKRPPVGKMRNIILSDIQADTASTVACAISGVQTEDGQTHTIENLILDNIRIRAVGGGLEAHTQKTISEREDSYPEYNMFGTIPSYGFFVRHVKNLKLNNLNLDYEKKDLRPALFLEDVKNAEIFGLDAESEPQSQGHIFLKNVNGALIHGNKAVYKSQAFVKVLGEKSKDIAIMGNDLIHCEEVFEKEKDVSNKAVYAENNRRKKKGLF